MTTKRLYFSDSIELNIPWGILGRGLALTSIIWCLMALAGIYTDSHNQSDRKELSTLSRLLLSMEDTGTGVMEVRGYSNEIYYSSPAANAILGYRDGELDGRNVGTILPAAFRDYHQNKVREAVTSAIQEKLAKPVSSMRCFALNKEGKEIEILVRVFVSKNGIFALLNRAEDVKYSVMPGATPEPR